MFLSLTNWLYSLPPLGRSRVQQGLTDRQSNMGNTGLEFTCCPRPQTYLAQLGKSQYQALTRIITEQTNHPSGSSLTRPTTHQIHNLQDQSTTIPIIHQAHISQDLYHQTNCTSDPSHTRPVTLKNYHLQHYSHTKPITNQTNPNSYSSPTRSIAHQTHHQL